VPRSTSDGGAHVATNAAAAARHLFHISSGFVPEPRAAPPPPPPPLPPGVPKSPGTFIAVCPVGARPAWSAAILGAPPAAFAAAAHAVRPSSTPQPPAVPPGLPSMHLARIAEEHAANGASSCVLADTSCSYCCRPALSRPIAGTKVLYCSECWEWYERHQIGKKQQQLLPQPRQSDLRSAEPAPPPPPPPAPPLLAAPPPTGAPPLPTNLVTVWMQGGGFPVGAFGCGATAGYAPHPCHTFGPIGAVPSVGGPCRLEGPSISMYTAPAQSRPACFVLSTGS